MMKDFVSKAIFFIVFNLIFYLTILFFWETFAPPKLKPNIDYRIGSYGHLYSRLSQVKQYNNIDILFLGSSHAYRGFDTRIFLENNLQSFNLGSSAQTPVQTKLLLNRYLDLLDPKLIVYEVSPTTFALDGVESSLDIIANDINDINSWKMAFKINNIKTYNTLLYGQILDLLGLKKRYDEPVIIGKDKYISGGYVEREITYFKSSRKEKNVEGCINYQLECFREITEMIKSKNIELVLVYTPVTKVKLLSYKKINCFDSLMSNFSTYYNFNEIVSLTDSLHFYDSHHLNQIGVNKFNNSLFRVLLKNNHIYKAGIL
jgi:hypothetical protein